MNKKFLLVIAIMFMLPIKSIGQKFKYWESSYLFKENEFAPPRISFYTRYGDDFVNVKMVNNSCFDIEYYFEMYSTKTYSGGYKMNKKIYRGILKTNQSKILFKKIPKRFSYLKISEYLTSWREDSEDYYIRAVQEKNWINNPTTLKCLGYSSKEALLADRKKKFEERQKIFLEELKKKEEEENRIKDLKLKKWLSKGLSYHKKHYEKSKQNSFFIDVPADTLEMFANEKGKFLLVINTFPTKYDLNKLNLTEDQKVFIENNLVAGTLRDWGFRKKNKYKKRFIDWMDEKKIKGGVPLVLLFDPEGNVLYNKYTNTTDLPKIIPALMDELFKQLPTID